MYKLDKKTEEFFFQVRIASDVEYGILKMFDGLMLEECLQLENRMEELDGLGLIILGKSRGSGVTQDGVPFGRPTDIYITDKGRNYKHNVAKQRIVKIVEVLVAAVLSGFFCWLFVKLLGY